MSFGVSITDIIKLIQLCDKFVKNVNGAGMSAFRFSQPKACVAVRGSEQTVGPCWRPEQRPAVTAVALLWQNRESSQRSKLFESILPQPKPLAVLNRSADH